MSWLIIKITLFILFLMLAIPGTYIGVIVAYEEWKKKPKDRKADTIKRREQKEADEKERREIMELGIFGGIIHRNQDKYVFLTAHNSTVAYHLDKGWLPWRTDVYQQSDPLTDNSTFASWDEHQLLYKIKSKEGE